MNISKVKLENRLILAPLGGMLNLPLRLAFRKFGASMTCIGVIDANAVVKSNRVKLINILGQEEKTIDGEKPVSIQLIGSDIDTLVEAAKRIEKFASIIDLNFGCPIKRFITQGYGGVNLLKDPGFIGEVVRAIVENVNVPVITKIRIGINGNDVDVLKIAKNCETSGISAIAIHSRSASEGFSGKVHWDFIKKVKESIGVPVIGNGGINSAIDVKAMFERTHCDFVMIGKAAIINPLIFLETNSFLQTGRLRKSNGFAPLAKFLREYAKFIKILEKKRLPKLVKKSYLDFFRMRLYIKKIKTGKITLK